MYLGHGKVPKPRTTGNWASEAKAHRTPPGHLPDLRGLGFTYGLGFIGLV